MRGLAVIAMLVAMVVLLMGITQLAHMSEDDPSPHQEIDEFKKELNKDPDVLGSHNVFRQFLARNRQESRHEAKLDESKTQN